MIQNSSNLDFTNRSHSFQQLRYQLHGPSMFAVKTKIYGVTYNQSSSIQLLMKHLVIGQSQKAPYFSAFHWSPHGSLVSIGQHFVTTTVAHLPNQNSAESGVAPAPPLHSHPHKKVMIISGRRNKCGNFIESTWIFSFVA